MGGVQPVPWLPSLWSGSSPSGARRGAGCWRRWWHRWPERLSLREEGVPQGCSSTDTTPAAAPGRPRGTGAASPRCDTELLSPPCALGWLGDSPARGEVPGVRALPRDPCHHLCPGTAAAPTSPAAAAAADFPEPCQALEGSGAHPGSQRPRTASSPAPLGRASLECCPGAWLPGSAPSSHSPACQAALIPPKNRQGTSPARAILGLVGAKHPLASPSLHPSAGMAQDPGSAAFSPKL